jgi:hypothetical protein
MLYQHGSMPETHTPGALGGKPRRMFDSPVQVSWHSYKNNRETCMKIPAATAVFAAFSLLLPAIAQAQQAPPAGRPANIRGVITAFDGNMLSIKSRDGGDVKVELPEGVNVAATKGITLADIRQGMVVGVTTVKRADGAVVAIDVRPIPATANLGLSPFDLQPGSTMTNAVMEAAVASSGGDELTLNYKTGSVKVLVPPGTPMSQSIPGSRADLKPGETVFVSSRIADDGRITAVRVQVSKDGVKPTQ